MTVYAIIGTDKIGLLCRNKVGKIELCRITPR